jgi:hypothetical protein
MLSPTLSNLSISHNLSQITLNHLLGNPRPSMLKTPSAGPLTSTPSLLLHPYAKAQPLHLYPQKLRAKMICFPLSEPFSPFRAAPLWNLIAKETGKITFVKSVTSVWKEE